MAVFIILLSHATIPLFVSCFVLFALNHYLNYRSVLNSIRGHPGFRLVFPIYGLIGNIMPRVPGVSMGQHWGMVNKHKPFAESGWDVLSIVSSYPRVAATLIIADPVAIKEVTLHRSRFPKSIKHYDVLSFFGHNILTTEGEEWKKHRKISAPAFSEKNSQLVWNETVRVVLDLFDTWGTNPEVVIDHVVDITLPSTLLVIGAAAFGRRVSSEENKRIPAGHQLSFQDALHNASTYVQFKLIAPKWAYSFSKFLRRVQLSFDELELYMQEMVAERRSFKVKQERNDLFSALLDGSEEKDTGGTVLTDHELIGNIFLFLIAGHETSAHTLCFAFGLLALEQDEQEKLYQHIISMLPNGKIPVYGNMNALTYSIGVIYEALRLFPTVLQIPKLSAEDTTLPAVQPDGTKGAVAVPKGTELILNVSGLHYNPRYWPDPERFDPSRFFGDYPKDAFLPFSGGARACLGRPFFETEGIAFLTMLVSRYKIELKNPGLYEGLTRLEKREKLLASRPGLTTTPLNVPLVFKKR